MYVNCFPLHFCCLQLVTKAMLLYNSAICDLLRESIQIMKILIHLKVVILVSEKWNEHNLMYIDHKQCEIMQKIQWNSSKANFTDFPLTDGAAVEQQCLCKWLQEVDSKGKWILVHQPARNERFLKVLNQFKAYKMIYKRGKSGQKPENRPCLEVFSST